MRPLFVAMAAAAVVAEAQEAEGPTVEYIGHAAVIVESVSGTRVLIDPYNGDMWMGYDFPEGLEVDAILVTHPHYDHDASWYFDTSVPVFRQPIQGIGGADVWFVTPFTPAADMREAARGAGVRIVVPVHYRLPELAAPGYSLPTADAWLGEELHVIRHPGHRVTYAPEAFPSDVEFHVLEPAPDLRAWTPELVEAWAIDTRSRERSQADDLEGSVALLRQAIELAPTVINFRLALAQALVEVRRPAEARETLARGLIEAPRSDTERTLRARGLLARLLADAGLVEQAEAQYRLVAEQRSSYAADVLSEARAFLERR